MMAAIWGLVCVIGHQRSEPAGQVLALLAGRPLRPCAKAKPRGVASRPCLVTGARVSFCWAYCSKLYTRAGVGRLAVVTHECARHHGNVCVSLQNFLSFRSVRMTSHVLNSKKNMS
jgi:hypothetical protein